MLDANTFCTYSIEFTWSETKRAANIKAHGVYLVDAASVFTVRRLRLKMTASPTASNASLRWACALAPLFQSYIRKTNMKSASSRSEKRPSASRKSTTMKSKTDWALLNSPAGDVKPTPEHPETDVKHIVRGLVRKGLKPLLSKASISLRVDQDVLEWFKAQGTGYQTRINTVLRAFRDASA